MKLLMGREISGISIDWRKTYHDKRVAVIGGRRNSLHERRKLLKQEESLYGKGSWN
jgi:hypothetical protein